MKKQNKHDQIKNTNIEDITYVGNECKILFLK